MTRFLLLTILLFGALSAAHAQTGAWEFGVNLGYSGFTPMLGQSETGLSGSPSSEVMLRAGPFVGLSVGYQPARSLLLRLNTSYSDRPVTGSDLGSVDFVSSTNLLSATLDLMYRFREGKRVNPFVALGAGVQSTNPGLEPFMCQHEGGSQTSACVPITTGGPVGTANSRSWALRESVSPALLVAAGADLRLSESWFVRAELRDRLFKPMVNAAQLSGADWTIGSESNQAERVHQFGIVVGVQFRTGGSRSVALATRGPIELKTASVEGEQCPEVRVWDTGQFHSAPLRASVVGTTTTARRALQNALSATAYRYGQSEAGAIITDWSPTYTDAETGRLRRHALFFAFEPNVGGTDIVARWLICSSAGAQSPWVVAPADRFAQPPDIEKILSGIPRR